MGFVPPKATNIERGPNFVAFQKGEQTHIRFTNHRDLARRIENATKYAAKNGGNLPQNAFWDKTADVYDDNIRLFKREHKCGPLLRLLRRDEAYDRDNPVLVETPPIPTDPSIPLIPNRPVPQSGGEVSPGLVVVPEPASAMMLCLGLLVIFVMGRRGMRYRARLA